MNGFGNADFQSITTRLPEIKQVCSNQLQISRRHEDLPQLSATALMRVSATCNFYGGQRSRLRPRHAHL
jgi:hypothetical protein